MESENPSNLLETRDLKKYFLVRKSLNPFSRSGRRYVKAVDGVTISIPRGKTVAIVGESGCGKTTLARTVAQLTPPTSGDIIFDGKQIGYGKTSLREIYKNIQIVFQDPDSSLDPKRTIEDTVGEPVRGLLGGGRRAVEERVARSLAAVGLSGEQGRRLPRQLSGGQKQRVAIARAIAPSPKLLILDEPTSALDASVQAQILRLLIELQTNFGLSYMLITHNIAVAQYLSDIVAVMYAGHVVEYGPTKRVLAAPRHPYTVTLMSAAPIANPWKRNLLNVEIKGEVPSSINPPPGCRFNPRCPYAEDVCTKVDPPLEEVIPGQFVACHFKEKTAGVFSGGTATTPPATKAA
ncbi:MAG: ABC transporter ATP-binding protein [Nitrososphaerota archaeon]|nr:ABC transporter ATP-binding protein [Nitrososphaerota archaeon]